MMALKRNCLIGLVLLLCVCTVSGVLASSATGIASPYANVRLTLGETLQPEWRFLPRNAEPVQLVMTSGDENVCRVLEDGKTIEAVGKGTCRITASTQDGKAKASFMAAVSYLVPDQAEIVFEAPQPQVLSFRCLGEEPQKHVSVSTFGKTVEPELDWEGDTLHIGLTPKLPGSFKLTVQDRRDRNGAITIPVTVLSSGAPIQNHIEITKASFDGLRNRITIRNHAQSAVNEARFVYRYFDRFGNQNFCADSVQELDEERQIITWSKLNGELAPGETLSVGLQHREMTSYFNTVRMEVAVAYYCDTEGNRFYIPENQLNWFSSEEKDYVGERHASRAIPGLTAEEKESIRRVDLGITYRDLYLDYAKHLYYSRSGEIITYVKTGSPADLCGLREGDLIVEADGVAWADDPLTLQRAHARFANGSAITLTVERENHETITVSLPSEPTPEEADSAE